MSLDVEQELKDAAERARHLVQTTEPRLFTVRPNNASWSASECIAHLTISTDMFLPVLRKAITTPASGDSGARSVRRWTCWGGFSAGSWSLPFGHA